MKKLWLIFCVLSAAAAGWILYDSMVVGLYFQDRRQGVFLLAAGLGWCTFYAWSVYMAGQERRRAEWEQDLMWRGGRWKIWLTGISAGAAAAGMGVYCLRYQSVLQITVCALLIMGWSFAAGCLLPLIKAMRKLPEEEFVSEWENRENNSTDACTLREEETVREMISKLVGIHNDHAVCQLVFCAGIFWWIAVYIQEAIRNLWMIGGLAVIVPLGFLLLEVLKNYRRGQVLKQLLRWMDEKRPQGS